MNMSRAVQQNPGDASQLPFFDQGRNGPRRLGVEIEFGGLQERTAAEVFARSVGGNLKQSSKGWAVETEFFGTCAVYLDTAYANEIEAAGGEPGLDAARLVIPVELVTDPFDPVHLPALDAAAGALRAAGATGSRKHLWHGFGLHLNIEVADLSAAHVGRVLCAYALLEPVLREDVGVDISRLALPFVNPYPASLVDAINAELPATMRELAQVYLAHTTSRNHGLDLLPILAEAAPDVVAAALPRGTKLSPRPAYHFRLPESRIDEPDWSLTRAWQLWVAVERVAASAGVLDQLRVARDNWQDAPITRRGRWPDRARLTLSAQDQEIAL